MIKKLTADKANKPVEIKVILHSVSVNDVITRYWLPFPVAYNGTVVIFKGNRADLS